MFNMVLRFEAVSFESAPSDVVGGSRIVVDMFKMPAIFSLCGMIRSALNQLDNYARCAYP